MSGTAPSGRLPAEADVLVIGAGMAGISAARTLAGAGRDVAVCEASDAVGGRIRTDRVDGFLIDRGFQLLNPGYPALGDLVDVDALQLGTFAAGAAVRTARGIAVLADPLRSPRHLVSTARAATPRLGSVLRLARWLGPVLRSRVGGGPVVPRLLAAGPDTTLRQALDEAGVEGLLRRTLDRFLAGVVLDDEGTTSATFARLLVHSFLTGNPGFPLEGMQALPTRAAQPLLDRIWLNTAVTSIEPDSAGGVRVRTTGTTVRAEHVVLATDGATAASLLGFDVPASKGVVTDWFAAPVDAVADVAPMLHLDGRAVPAGPVVNACVVSRAQPSYAPPGRALVQASALLGRAPSVPPADIAVHAEDLLGLAPGTLELVTRTEVPRALPAQPPPLVLRRSQRLGEAGVLVAGDHRDTGSIQGAIVSGRRAARAL